MVWSARGFAFIHTRWCQSDHHSRERGQLCPRKQVARSEEHQSPPPTTMSRSRLDPPHMREDGLQASLCQYSSSLCRLQQAQAHFVHRCIYLQCELCCRALAGTDGHSAGSEASDILVSSDQQGDSEQQQGQQAS